MFWLAPRTRFRLYTKGTDYMRLLRDAATGRTTTGDDTARLERALEAFCGTPHAVCMPQARVGIYLAVKLLIKPGQTVVMSPYTIADVVNMVICAGGVPVFADIDRPSTNVSADAVEKLIDSRTGAVLVTHLHGIACDIHRIVAICRAKGVPLIEDAAQAFGARIDGRRVGTFGDAGIYSFGMYKSVTGFYGGALVTPRREIADAARSTLASAPPMELGTITQKAMKALLTDVVTSPPLFRSIVYWIFRFGYLHRINAINKFVTIELDTSRKSQLPPTYLRRMRPAQARMILRQLEKVDQDTAVRLGFSRLYYEGLRDIPGLIVPPFRDDGSNVYNYFPIQYADRDALVRWLMLNRRDLAVQHLKNCAALDSFAPEYRACPNAELTARQVILLPNYPSYGEQSVRANIAAIRSFFDANTERRASA
jgi:dTDP-4-amino-4,6-dideoxygalactose transaminase